MKSIINRVFEELLSRFDRYGFIHIQNQGGTRK